MHACHACIYRCMHALHAHAYMYNKFKKTENLHAYSVHAYVDVDMQVHIFMSVSAYACIRMHGMHIPLAGAAHQGGYLGDGGGHEP